MASVSGALALPLFFTFLFFASPAASDHSPVNPPTLAPQPPADKISPSSATHASAPSPVPSYSSPPAPPPPDLAASSPAPASAPENGPVPRMPPSPLPADVGDVGHEKQPNAGDLTAEAGSSGGMSGGQKAGVAIGVIAGACVVGAGALVYRKRRQNIQRAQYGYAARRQIL